MVAGGSIILVRAFVVVVLLAATKRFWDRGLRFDALRTRPVILRWRRR
jgi:hypothetical protein